MQNYDPAKKASKKAFFGFKKFADWQQGLINLINRVNAHLSGRKRLDEFEVRDVAKKGFNVLKASTKVKKVRVVQGQKIVYWE
jgi:hypothetical protein